VLRFAQRLQETAMPAYLIADVEVTDAAAYAEYRQHVPAMIAAYGGKYVVRGGATEPLEGGWLPRRIVVLEFPSMDRLRAFYDSADYAPMKALRMGASDSRIIAVEGL
jgi:uncharacterized protein (DUF1330 family)